MSDLYPSALIGYRAWVLREPGYLCSTMGQVPWRTPTEKASCYFHAHRSPDSDCHCGLYAFHEGFVWPNLLGVFLSTQVVLYVLFGGVGTLIGAVIGVTVIESLTFVLADRWPEVWPVVLGVILLLVILFRRSGLAGLIVPERERFGSFGRPPKGRAP